MVSTETHAARLSNLVRREGIWLLLALLALYSALKGSNGELASGGKYYWYLDYDDGFIRRAFVGALWSALTGHLPADFSENLIVWLHRTAVIGLIGVSVLGLRYVTLRVQSQIWILGAAILLFALQTWPHLMHLTGFLDPYIFLVLALAVYRLISRRPFQAGIVCTLALPIHEQVVFYWAPIVVAYLILEYVHRQSSLRKLVVEGAMLVGLPCALMLVLYAMHDTAAAASAILHVPISDDLQCLHRVHALNPNFGTVMREMAMLWTNYWPNAIIVLAFHSGPTLLLCFLILKALKAPLVSLTALAICVGSFGYLGLIVIAADLSRFAANSGLAWLATSVIAASYECAPKKTVPGFGSIKAAFSFEGKTQFIVVLLVAAFAYYSAPLIEAQFNEHWVVRGWHLPGGTSLLHDQFESGAGSSLKNEKIDWVARAGDC